jgi:ribose 5-phosphate isomerase B
VLCLGGRTIDNELAKTVVSIWLNTEFEGGRHELRVKKLDYPLL